MAWNDPGNKGNDPWGGGGRGGGDQGPPDLDEVIRKLTGRFNRLFGGGSGGGGGGGLPGGGVSAGLLAALIVVAVVVWAAMGFYTVDEAERGVVFRFGEVRDELVMPGLRWNPPLIDEVQTVNVSRINTSSYSNDMLTADENIVTVSVSVQYVIQDPMAYVVNVRDAPGALNRAMESATRHVVGSTPMDRVLTEGRAEVAQGIHERAQTYLDDYGTGARVTQVNVEDAQPPTAVREAFDDVIRAREDEERAQNNAQAYANRVIPETRGEAQRIIEQASAYREEVVARAQGQADRFELLLAEYQSEPEIMRERLYIDAMQDVLSNTSKVLVDVENGNNMMFLPLDRMVNRGGSAGGSGSGSDALRLNDEQMRNLADRIEQQISSSSSSSRDSRARVQSVPGRGGR